MPCPAQRQPTSLEAAACRQGKMVPPASSRSCLQMPLMVHRFICARNYKQIVTKNNQKWRQPTPAAPMPGSAECQKSAAAVRIRTAGPALAAACSTYPGAAGAGAASGTGCHPRQQCSGPGDRCTSGTAQSGRWRRLAPAAAFQNSCRPGPVTRGLDTKGGSVDGQRMGQWIT